MSRFDFPTFVDIDGTLTDNPEYRLGKPLMRRIDKVRLMIRNGEPVVIWSAGGTEYAKEFCRKHALNPMAVLGKPFRVVDDHIAIFNDGVEVSPPEFLD